MTDALYVTPGLTIPAADLHWVAVRASGPGGQNVNKVSSKVELRFDLLHSTAIDEATKARLRSLPGARLDAAGALVVTSQLTRDQRRNLEDARGKLTLLLLRALERPRKRRPTAPTRASRKARLESKRLHARKKRERRTRDE